MALIEPFQDAVKAVSELRKLVHDLVGDGRLLWEVHERQKGKKAAKSLGTLSFQNDGVRHHLERVAAGKAGDEDFAAIAAKLDETGEAVEGAMDHLNEVRDHIREKHGLGVANDLSELIYGRGGKSSIRIDIQELLYLSHDQTPDPEIAQHNARLALENMEKFNKRVEALHDMLLSLKKP